MVYNANPDHSPIQTGQTAHTADPLQKGRQHQPGELVVDLVDQASRLRRQSGGGDDADQVQKKDALAARDGDHRGVYKRSP